MQVAANYIRGIKLIEANDIAEQPPIILLTLEIFDVHSLDEFAAYVANECFVPFRMLLAPHLMYGLIIAISGATEAEAAFAEHWATAVDQNEVLDFFVSQLAGIEAIKIDADGDIEDAINLAHAEYPLLLANDWENIKPHLPKHGVALDLSQLFSDEGIAEIDPEDDPEALESMLEAIEDYEFDEEWYELKSSLLNNWLGPQHESVLHSLIPYEIGGSVHLYFFEDSAGGTAISTNQLSQAPGQGPQTVNCQCAEIAMFLAQPFNGEALENEESPDAEPYYRVRLFLNLMATYTQEAVVGRGHTLEFPEDFEHIGGSCFIFDEIGPDEEHHDFGVLVPIEIHRSEMNFAREIGGAILLDRLKDAGHYPYSGIDREPVA